jgi:hypothetical protein
MTEEEWRETAAAQAVLTFVCFMMSVMMNTIGGVVGGLLTKGLSWLAKKKAEEDGAAKPELLTSFYNPDRDEALRTALIVVAAWSAFEACIEDFCKGVLQANMAIIGNPDFEKIKIPVGELLAPEDEKLDNVYQAMQDSVGKSQGVNRFEGLLKLVGLNGQVPKVIKEGFFAAQMVRNVWAHKAGTADLKFVRQAPHLGYTQGELVSITTEQLTDYLTAILAYAAIITNRHRAEHGLGPMPIGDDMRPTPILDAYRGMYPSMQKTEQDRA